MGEMKWQFSVLGIRIGWYKHLSALCIDRRNGILQIGRLEFWHHG